MTEVLDTQIQLPKSFSECKLLPCGFSLVAESGGFSFAVYRLLIVMASVVAEQGPRAPELQ